MENLVHDSPFRIDFEQRKQVGEPMAGPVVEFQSHRGNRLDDIDAGNPALKSCCWTILVIPVKELLDGPGEQVSADVAKDRRIRVEGGLHASPRLAAIDVGLNRPGNRVVLTQTGRFSDEVDQFVASTATHVPLKAAVPQRASTVRLSVMSLMLSPACCCATSN